MRPRWFGVVLIPLCAAGLHAQNAASRIPRMANGKPNLNGIWQAMSTAHWDLEDHPAQPAALVQMGAIGAVPAGYGVVEGGRFLTSPRLWRRRRRTSRIG